MLENPIVCADDGSTINSCVGTDTAAGWTSQGSVDAF